MRKATLHCADCPFALDSVSPARNRDARANVGYMFVI